MGNSVEQQHPNSSARIGQADIQPYFASVQPHGSKLAHIRCMNDSLASCKRSMRWPCWGSSSPRCSRSAACAALRATLPADGKCLRRSSRYLLMHSPCRAGSGLALAASRALGMYGGIQVDAGQRHFVAPMRTDLPPCSRLLVSFWHTKTTWWSGMPA